jgi:hypothetical protein
MCGVAEQDPAPHEGMPVISPPVLKKSATA